MPAPSEVDVVAGRDARVVVLEPLLAVEADVAADPQLRTCAFDRFAAYVDELDAQEQRRRRGGRQVMTGADIGERRDRGDGAVLAVRARGELDALADGVAIVHAEPRVLAVRHVAVLALHAASHVWTFEPFLVRVEQRLAVDRGARWQLMTRHAEIGALVDRELDERVAWRRQ